MIFFSYTHFTTEPIIIPRIEQKHVCTTPMSDMKPVYLCLNAIRSDHECRWAVCYACKTKHDEEMELRVQGDVKKKRRLLRNHIEHTDQDKRNELNAKYDNNMFVGPEDSKHVCKHDHKHLVDFTAMDYFSKSHQYKLIADEISFPTHCVSCKLRISSTGWSDVWKLFLFLVLRLD